MFLDCSAAFRRLSKSMPFYEYRQLNPDEQRALVQQRIARGFPQHRPPHLEQGAGYYLLTAAVYEHRALIDPAARRDQFQDALLAADEAHFYRALNYIHANPVHHGYVLRSRDWRWSSLVRYVNTVGMEWIESTWRRYPVGDFGKGWDDNTSDPPEGGTT